MMRHIVPSIQFYQSFINQTGGNIIKNITNVNIKICKIPYVNFVPKRLFSIKKRLHIEKIYVILAV
jgi:hypothetical protein